MQLNGRTIWLEVNADKFETAIQDVLLSATPQAWRGNYLVFKVGLFFADAPFDLANLQSLTLEVFASTRLGDALMTKTVAAADITALITQEAWNARTASNATFVFTDEETLLDLGGAKEKDFWLVVTALTTDDPDHSMTMGGGAFTLYEPGPQNAVLAAAQAPTGYTRGQADARYVQLWADNAGVRFLNGYFYFFFPEDGSWARPVPGIVDGVRTLGWEVLT